MNEEGGYLGAMTYQCLYSGIFDKLRANRRDDQAAQAAIHVSSSVFLLAIYVFRKYEQHSKKLKQNLLRFFLI